MQKLFRNGTASELSFEIHFAINMPSVVGLLPRAGENAFLRMLSIFCIFGGNFGYK